MHRKGLAVFYYFPMKIVNGIINTIKQLLIIPPMLCLVALALRQVVGKMILGAKLPDKVEDGNEHKDVISMVKQFVTNFALATFPTAASLYDAWVHLRADMYVIVCGLLVGLAWKHSDYLLQEITGKIGKIVSGGSDEL